MCTNVDNSLRYDVVKFSKVIETSIFTLSLCVQSISVRCESGTVCKAGGLEVGDFFGEINLKWHRSQSDAWKMGIRAMW